MTLRVRGRVISQFPLEHLEVVYNGAVVATTRPEGDGLEVAIDQDVPVDRSGWIALRVAGPPHPDQATGAVYAHTSAIYIDVPGRPALAREDAHYFLAWIDRLENDVKRRDRVPARQQAHVASQLSAARAVYKAIAQK
jgi:hypothetical protein